MRILVTGANGFVGRHLVSRLCELGGLGDGHEPMSRLILLSRKFENPPQHDDRVQFVKGSIADRETVIRAVKDGVDCVFHLASIPTGDAERDFDAGSRVNLAATLSLLEILRSQARPPVVVFSSSIGVFGTPFPDHISDDTQLLPTISYGAQKLVGEVVLTDYSRRGFCDGRSVRLPGVLARPKNDGGALSLFLSNIFHAFADGDVEFICPVSASATMWLMSIRCCVDNLLHAGHLPSDALGLRRAWTLPTLRIKLEDLACTLAEVTGHSTRVIYEPDEMIETLIGRLPAISTPLADRLGFKHDGSLKILVDRVLKSCNHAAAPAKSLNPIRGILAADQAL